MENGTAEDFGLNTPRGIERAIRALPYIPREFRAQQASRIAGALYPVISSWAPGLTRKCGDVRLTHVEDAAQVAAMAVVETLQEYAAGAKHQHVVDWMPYLHGVARNCVSKYFKSSAVTPTSGRTNLERRVARIPGTVDRLRAELMREPTAVEVVDSHNAMMRARQVNAAKHGSLISLHEARAFVS